MRQVIVTGGAGYIGSHIVKELLRHGTEVHVIDNFQTGRREWVPNGAAIHEADVTDYEQICEVFNAISGIKDTGVIHAAGLKFASESVRKPIEFYEANTVSTILLLKAMGNFGITNLVFSSSSSVYGKHLGNLAVHEDSPLQPISPYGRSKLFSENIIQDARTTLGINSISLRYFNVIGGELDCAVDKSIYNLLPNLYRAMENKSLIEIYGDSYETPDGTCIRDYVDVRQLAKAHIYSLAQVFNGTISSPALNLGSGTGYSVREIVQVAQNLVDFPLSIEIKPGRDGDPPITLADISRASMEIDWNPTYSIQESIESGWKCWSAEKYL